MQRHNAKRLKDVKYYKLKALQALQLQDNILHGFNLFEFFSLFIWYGTNVSQSYLFEMTPEEMNKIVKELYKVNKDIWAMLPPKVESISSDSTNLSSSKIALRLPGVG